MASHSVNRGLGSWRALFDRHFGRRLFRTYLAILLSIVGVIWLVRILNILDFFLSIGAGFGEAVKLCLLLLPTFFGYAAAPALMIAMLVFYAGILNSREYYVVTGVGVSPFRVFKPVLAVASAAALLIMLVHFFVAPWASQLLRQERATIQDRMTLDFVKPRRFVDLVDGITIYTDRVLENGGLENVLIFDGRDPAREVSYSAQRAMLQHDLDGQQVFILSTGSIETLTAERKETLRFERYQFPLMLPTAKIPDPNHINPAHLMVYQLLQQLAQATDERLVQLRARLLQMIGEILMPFMFAAIVVACVTGGELRRYGYGRRVAGATLIAICVFAGLVAISAQIGAYKIHYIWAVFYPLAVIGAGLFVFRRQALRPPV